jgi:hypothetical protein
MTGLEVLDAVTQLALPLAEQPAAPGFECYVDSDQSMFGCLFGTYTDSIGEELVGLLVGGMVMLGLYVASDGDLAVPAVVTTLFGGILIGALPGSYQDAAQVIMFLGLAAAIFGLLKVYLVEGPAT